MSNPKLNIKEETSTKKTRSPPKKTKVEQTVPKRKKLKTDAEKAAEKAQHLRFGKAELTPDELSRLSKAQKREMYAAHAARSAVHREVDQYEDDNVGTQALSEGEKAAGNVRDISKSRYARKLKKKAKAQGKKDTKTARSSAQEPTAAQDAGASSTGEGGSNWLSRWKQRQEIHKSYYTAARSGTAAQTAGGKAASNGASAARSGVEQAVEKGKTAVSTAVKGLMNAAKGNAHVLVIVGVFLLLIVNLRLPDGETRRKGIDSTKYLWVAKLRCRCGSSYRIFNWRKLKDGTPVFGYQCNMRTVNPTRSFVLEHNMTEQLSCDAISIPEWKLELMAKKIFEKVWGNQNKAILRACKMIESCQNGKAATRMSAAPIQSKIEKIKKRKLNYAAMRADGELPREEYQALCKQADDEIARLEQELKALSPAPEPQTVSSDMKAIYDFLSQKVDVHGARLAPELIDQFVEVVTPFADYSYRWKLSTGCKKSKEERADLMAVSEKPILTFTIDFETAKRYREANKMPHQFRRAAWTDLTVEVYL